MSSPTVLVTGATGCIGREVVRHALARGAKVRALVVPGERPELPSIVQIARGTLADRASLVEACANIDAIVHLAARVHSIPRDEAERSEMYAVNVEGTQNLVDAAESAKVGFIAFASTVGVYARGDSEAYVDESFSTHDVTPYIASKLAGERLVLDAGGCVLRIVLAFGEGDRGNFGRLLRHAKRGLYVCVGDGHNQKSLVFAPHVGERLARLAIEQPSWAARGIYNLADGALTQRQILEAIRRELGGPPIVRVPLAPVRLVGRALDAGARRLGQPIGWEQRVSKMAESTWFNGERLDGLLDYRPTLSLEEAIAVTARELR